MNVSDIASCAFNHPLIPNWPIEARSAGLGPYAACSRNRAWLRFTVGGGVAFTVTAASANTVGVPALVARTVTFGAAGMTAGAVYKPVAEIVPYVELPPAVPFTVHVTFVFAEFETVAVNCCVAP